MKLTMNSISKGPTVIQDLESMLFQMKLEVADELGINLHADTSSRLNGTVGGEMVKRMVLMGEEMLSHNHTGTH